MARRSRIDELARLAVPEDPNCSPDGGRIAYVVRRFDIEEDRTLRSLWQADRNGGERRRLTWGDNDRSPVWSPDGRQLAFLRDVNGVTQLWMMPADGGEAERLTAVPLGTGRPVWSPDGTRLAFTASVDIAAWRAGAGDRQSASAGAPVVTERIDYQVDGSGLVGTVRQHVHVLDLRDRVTRQITRGDWHAGEPAWSPDGERLAFPAGMDENADLTGHRAAYVIDAAAEGPEPRLIGSADGYVNTVVWDPSGDALLIVDHPQGPSGHARLFRLPIDGGERRELAPDLDRNVMVGAPGYPGARPQFSSDGGSVVFCIRDAGCTHVYAVGIDGGDARCLVGGEGRTVSGMSVARSAGTLAVVLGTPSSYGEVVALDTDGDRQVACSDLGSSALVEPFRRIPRAFKISDGTTVHGWLVTRPDVSAPQPLLLDIHGGPHNAWNGAADEVHLYHQELADLGWLVLVVNPRGSDGYGERFFTAVSGGWGVRDMQDLLEPIDLLVAEGLADPARLAVSGYSYGGFMTCFLTSRDRRFAAAVAGGMIGDPTSVAGTSDEAQWLAVHEFHAQPWEDPERYAALSPYAKVHEVETPTLLLHGENDLRCPIGQSKQWHAALRVRGVPSRLVIYPGASHGFIAQGRPSHRLDFNRRVVEWVERVR